MTLIESKAEPIIDRTVAAPREIEVLPRDEWDPGQVADIAKFREQLASYQSGEMPEDVFRVFRLNNGIYGQRQGGTNQMVRVKLPYGSMTPEQLEMMGYIAERYSRGWGHITTRQNIQFHFVQLADIPDLMEHLASVGLTSREACGDTVRNIQGCHLAGACPQEVLDITQWAEAAFQHFVRNPLGQRLPRKFKINFSGCSTDCGQAMFNDAGVVAVTRTLAQRRDRARLPRLHRRWARRHPAPGAGARGVHVARRPAADDRGDPAGVRPGRQPRQQAAGPPQVADRHARLRRGATPDPQGPPPAAGLVVVAGRHPARSRRARRRAGGRHHRRPGDAGRPRCRAGDAGQHRRPLALRPLAPGQRRARRRQRHGVGLRLGLARRHHRRSVPPAGGDPARPRRQRAPHQPSERGVPRPHRRAAAGPVRAARGDRHGPARRRALA